MRSELFSVVEGDGVTFSPNLIPTIESAQSRPFVAPLNLFKSEIGGKTDSHGWFAGRVYEFTA